MNLKLLFVLTSALLLPQGSSFKSSSSAGAGAACPDGSVPLVQVFEDQFGPEEGDWQLQQLDVPKFSGPLGARLIQVDVELCGRATGDVQFQNNDDLPCTLLYGVTVDAGLEADDPTSPLQPFVLSLQASGGPIDLAPGQQGSDAFDSGPICNPAQTFTSLPALNHFISTPGDKTLVFNHSGVSNSSHFGCGIINFQSTTFSSLSVTVKYTYCLVNKEPICNAGCDYFISCIGNPMVLALDSGMSHDPDGTPLTYLWTTTCANSTIADPTAATTTISVDTTGCNVECQAHLTVSDGFHSDTCRIIIVIN